MKYVFAIPLSTAALFGLVACTNPEATSEDESPTTEETMPAEPLEPEEQPLEPGEQPLEPLEPEEQPLEPLDDSPDSPESIDPNSGMTAPAAGTESDLELAATIQAELNAQLPDNQLVVQSDQGNVLVTGEVATVEEMQIAEVIVLETEGVQGVNMQVDMVMPKS
ncbi:MAG: BON domain-containing protein [Cyanobacteria bacterium P01_D01_bin.71]